MEPLQKQLAELPQRLAALSTTARLALGLGVVALAGIAVAVAALGAAPEYQYAYTNLSTEDSAEIAARLKAAGVPFRLEAGGAALMVPPDKVYDARLLLAADGLPRAGGSGFELFDKGDFGVSEFTQKVNLRRATEGELARTIGRLSGVRSARVHLVLAEKGVFKGDDRPASAAVMVTLQPAHTLAERELAGIRHLVASAVPGLSAQAVTVVDGRGAVLSADDEWGADVQGYQRKLERDLEQRVVTLLEPVVGPGQVVARVNAALDAAEVTTTDDAFDPDGAVLKSERTVAQNQSQDAQRRQGGVVGAAANQPLSQPTTTPPGTDTKSSSTNNEETRNYELSRTTTRTVVKAPRLSRLSVAVLLDGVDGKPRADAEVARLGELVRRAVGLDEQRGDQLEIRSAVFTRSVEDAPVTAPAPSTFPRWAPAAAVAAGLFLLLSLAVFVMRRRRTPPAEGLVLRPGARVAELEAGPEPVAVVARSPVELPQPEPPRSLSDGTEAARARARELARADPARAAHLIRAWLNVEASQAR